MRVSPFSTDEVLELLSTGEMEVEGLLPWSSNYTFLVKIIGVFSPAAPDKDGQVMAVYKPRRGEAPLWDFPDGTLCQRELAAYLVSTALGWDLIPPDGVTFGGAWVRLGAALY